MWAGCFVEACQMTLTNCWPWESCDSLVALSLTLCEYWIKCDHILLSTTQSITHSLLIMMRGMILLKKTVDYYLPTIGYKVRCDRNKWMSPTFCGVRKSEQNIWQRIKSVDLLAVHHQMRFDVCQTCGKYITSYSKVEWNFCQRCEGLPTNC